MMDKRLDRSAFSIETPEEAVESDRAYWLSKTPQERVMAAEYLRQLNYGYDPATARIQRHLEIAEQA